MATENPQPPEGFDEAQFSNQNDSEDVETVNLDAGESISGTVVSLQDGENENGDWYRLRINSEDRGVVDYFAKGDVKKAARAGEVRPNRDIWIAKQADVVEFEDDDGEAVSYNPTKVAFPGDA
jgi:hypothetical protein